MTPVSVDSRKQSAVHVEFEYGALREVIIGRPEGFRIPELSAVVLQEYSQFLAQGGADFLHKGQGQMLLDYAPDVAAGLAAQVEQLVSILERRGVIVHRPRPLTEAEVLFPGFGPAGGSLFFMRDPILVAGRRIIDLAMRFAAKNIEVIASPFDLPARFGGGLRCAHHPLVRA